MCVRFITKEAEEDKAAADILQDLLSRFNPEQVIRIIAAAQVKMVQMESDISERRNPVTGEIFKGGKG